MSEAMTSAYRMARQGYGWEDIQAKNPSLPKAAIWQVLLRVHAQKVELARVLVPLKKEKGNHLHG